MMRVGAVHPVPFLSPSPTQIPMAAATPTTPAPFRFLLPFFSAPTALSPSATTLFRCLPSPFPPIPHSNTTRIRHSQKLMVVVTAAAGSSSFRNGSAPETECPVPFEQQPVNEYQSLSNSALFSWAAGDLWTYTSRLLAMGVSFSLFVGLPVARFGIIDPERDVLRCGIGAISGGLFLVTLAALRMYLGWAYVGNRLLSATVEYEETGWYDGQIWVKTPEVLARDRLLGSYSVKPVLNRVKLTLVGLAASLVISILLFISIESPKKESISSGNGGVGAVSGVYSDASARSFEPDAFCGEPDLS